MTTFVIRSTEFILYGFCIPWEQVPGRWGSRSSILKSCLVVTTFVICSDRILTLWVLRPLGAGSREVRWQTKLNTNLPCRADIDPFWQNTYSMSFTPLGSKFQGGEVADQMTTFVICSTEYLLYEICVPWEQVPGRWGSRPNDDICDLFYRILTLWVLRPLGAGSGEVR